MTQPTHNRGHILDLVLSKGLNISKVLVSDVALSEHYCVFFGSDLCTQMFKLRLTQSATFTENTGDIFSEAFSPPPPLSRFSVNDLVYHFSSKITNVIDAIAPINVKVISGTKKSPWRNTMLDKTGKKEMSKS